MVVDRFDGDFRSVEPLYLVGGTEELSDTFDDELGWTVETVSPERVGDALGRDARGVVCFPSDSHDGGSLAPVVETVVETVVDCPVAVVGQGIDAPAVYRAGATGVVPLSPNDCPELVADRVAALVERGDRSPSADADPAGTTNAELVDALSTAFPDYAFVYDEDGQYLDVMTGRRTDNTLYTDEELLGRQVHDLFDAETADSIVAAIREALSTGDVQTLEYALDRQDGVSRYRARIAPLSEPYDGRPAAVLAARDVTERRRGQRIRRQLLSHTREMMAAESHEQLARIVSEAASSVLGHELNVVYLREPDEDRPLTAAAWSERVGDVLDGPPSLTGDGPVSEAYRSGEPAIHDDLTGVTDRPADRYAPVASLIAVPIGDRGVLAVGATERGAFTEADIDRYRLLTVSAVTAFDRLERTVDLRRYETLFETVRDMVYVLDEDGFVELVNEPLAEAVGYDSDTLEGKHASTFVTDGTAREIEHLTLDLVVAPDDVSSTCEGTLRARDGTETPVEIELSVLPHEGEFRGTAGVVRDISERRQREEELRVFQRAITEAGIGLAMYGADGRFEYVNDHYADLLDTSRDALEGTHIWEAIDPLDSDTFGRRWAAIDAGNTETRETEHVRGDDSTVPVETVTTAVDIDGVRHHILTVQDVTDRRERRQQTEALHRIFRHNLRNDLTVVKSHAAILSAELPAAYEEHIDAVIEKAEQLVDLTETATEARKVLEHDTSRMPVDAARLIREQIRDLRSRFDVTVEADLPDAQHVWADAMFEVALKHLLTNAVEHHDPETPRVWVRMFPTPNREDWVTIEVADDGPGIPDIERETLAAGEEDPLQHSVGLGLWIVRWIVSRYGGDLSFHDREPQGSRVQIALPRVPAHVLDDRPAEGPA
jgi:PAS domain S-box-containing protein